MTSENTTIDTQEYIDQLPTFKPRGKEFAAELTLLLKGDTLRSALAIVEERALLLEKTFVEIDFHTEEGKARAIELKGKINALRQVPEMLIANANGDDLDGREQPISGTTA